ncbi:hypothetical protein NLJ89_g9529 [Agrocybe chaxingu]|uniref:CxC2-like cysteine cluster KDZ transposase-associated domain-containing protein n=1 Tax=Agrocybe chaxingu TaxID=84603 RepID=A0A9W8JVN6_9AGAR|nr:hypothetical protein NLJ89_g9529 [Agrocybe chaxingu]
MSSNARPNKRQRTGNAYHDVVPLPEYYQTVHAREGRLRRVGNDVLTASTCRTEQESTGLWSTATSWAPLDDPEFALDPTSEQYERVVEADVMAGIDEIVPPKKAKSRVSVRQSDFHDLLHLLKNSFSVVLMSFGKNSIEATISMKSFAGKEDASFAGCKDAQTVLLVGLRHLLRLSIGVKSAFFLTWCAPAFVLSSSAYADLKKKWSGEHFIKVSLKSLGLRIQLNHTGMVCPNPIPCHSEMVILHTNGLHEAAVNYCGCSRAIPQHIQLLRRRLYPASQVTVKTCATFQLLEHLHRLALTTKASTYDFYRALLHSTNNTGIDTPKSRYRALFRTILQWRHLKLLKRAGRGHDPAGILATKPGELAVQCPSCPRPGINLPEGWRDVSDGKKFLYMMFVCMDANFRLKNQLVSNYSQDPGLGIGWAYMVPRAPYEQYVLGHTNDEDISTCVGFQALAQANTKATKGLRYTGVNGAMCGRSEMVLPLAVGNLQKGERYANMDYTFASAIRGAGLAVILISYDICCQWFTNLYKRMEEHWPSELRVPSTTKLIPAIPKLHEPMHQTANHQMYSLNFIRGVGKSDMEVPERVWAGHNALGNSTKTQAPGSRSDTLDDHIAFWNWLKEAIREWNIQIEGHRGLTASLDKEVVQKWEAMCSSWEEDGIPRTKPNPYHTEGISLSEAKVRKQLAEEEKERLAKGGIILHVTSAASFITHALEIEDAQRRIKRLARSNAGQGTARQEGGLTEQRNQLRSRISSWEQLLPIYIPGILQYKASIPAQDRNDIAENPEDVELWLPSRIAADSQSMICIEGLPAIEEKLRTAQCFDSLDGIRHILTIKSRMVAFKNKNIRGQREGTRSRSIIDRVHERARASAEKYRAARSAKLALSGHGPWEEELQELHNNDVRGYQDPDRIKHGPGRRGTLDDEQVAAGARQSPDTADDDNGELSLFNETRTRRDGTGETRRTISWIWCTKSRTPKADDLTDEILRVEWAKSRARVARCKEEVLLLQEEMRRTLSFLEWKSDWWKERAQRHCDVAKELSEGLAAYAADQSDLQIALTNHFRTMWERPLDAPVTRGADDEQESDAEDEEDADEEDADEEVNIEGEGKGQS